MFRTRKKLRLLVLVMMVTVIVAACSNGNDSDSKETGSPTASSPSATSTASAVTMDDGPLGKYDPPITFSTVRKFNSDMKFPEGQNWENNVYVNGYKDELGIELKNLWLVDTAQYTQKLNVSMISGNLPDLFEVDLQQLQNLVEAGAIADLTEVYDKYASELTKKSLEVAINLKTASFDGKLMALLAGGGGREDLQFIYIRKDWLTKLNLQPPKTMDDVVNIAKAFANGDPDGNNKKDTYGLSLDQNLFGGFSALDGFFHGYHAYPFNPGGDGTGLNTVFLDKGGMLEYADIQPEVKTALGKLNELYKAGAIPSEFSVNKGQQSAEQVTSGKVGMIFGQYWIPSWPLNDMVKNDPKIDWGIYPIVSADDQPVLGLSNGIVPTTFWAVNKNSKHPEAAVKLLNFFMEKNYGESRDEKYHTIKEGDQTIQTHGLSPISGGFVETNQNDFYSVQEALKSGDGSKLNPTAKVYYDNILDYRKGKTDAWWYEKLFGTENESTYGILGQFKKNKQFMTNAFLGSPTPSMKANGPALRDLEVKTFTRIIMGEDPLDSFDQFVADWKSQGGDKILAEVNEWYKTHK